MSSPHGNYSARLSFPRVISLLMGAFVTLSCLDRINPFDPVNIRGGISQETRAGQNPFFDTLSQQGKALSLDVENYRATLRASQAFTDSIALINATRRTVNTGTDAENQKIRVHNETSVPESLQVLTLLDTLLMFPQAGPFTDSSEIYRRIGNLHLLGLARMDSLNRQYAPLVIFSPTSRDSLNQSFVLLELEFREFFREVTEYVSAVSDSNTVVSVYNAERRTDNVSILAYNESILFRKNTASKGIIANSDSLTKATQAARPGDTLYLQEGLFEVRLLFSQSGTVDSPIVIQGHPSLGTVLSPANTEEEILFLNQNNHIQFRNLIFRNSAKSGIKLVNYSRGVSFRNCRFEGNAGYGLEVDDAELELVDCVITGNALGGLNISGSGDGNDFLRLHNVLIDHNGGNGVRSVSTGGEFLGVTIAHNDSNGLHLVSPIRPFTVVNSILAFNGQHGLKRNSGFAVPGMLNVRASSLFGNTAENVSVDSLYYPSIENLNSDPLFLDADGRDYRLRPASHLVELERLGITIGYRYR